MVSQSGTSNGELSQRRMLTHSSDKRRHRASSLGSAHRQEARDPGPILITSLVVVGLICIVLAVLFVYARRTTASRSDSSDVRRLGVAALGAQDQLTARLLSAEATRDAQQAALEKLRVELGRARQELAAVSVQPAMTAMVPGSGSVSLDKAPLALVLDVPVYKQERSLSCESSAAAMAANYQGIPLSEQEILDALPRHENPHQGFRGDTDGPYGGIDDYGVYADPVRQVLEDHGLHVEHLSGGPDAIRAQIRQGKPVIVWVTFGLQAQVPRQAVLSDGQTVTLIPYEHTVLVVGYNRDGLWVNDPYAGTQDFYVESDFVRSFAYLGNMGLVVGPPTSR